jgi:hypothetical protein
MAIMMGGELKDQVVSDGKDAFRVAQSQTRTSACGKSMWSSEAAVRMEIAEDGTLTLRQTMVTKSSNTRDPKGFEMSSDSPAIAQ